MDEVSIIIDGVRYDAEEGTRCLQCDLFKGICNIYSTTHRVKPLSRCPLKDGYIFKKSTKSFEKCEWIDVNDRLPNKDENVLVVMQDTDKTVHVEIRWRSIYDDVLVDENGFAIYPPVEQRVLAWLPIPNYKKEQK